MLRLAGTRLSAYRHFVGELGCIPDRGVGIFWCGEDGGLKAAVKRAKVEWCRGGEVGMSSPF